jgi:hypothetical protein
VGIAKTSHWLKIQRMLGLVAIIELIEAAHMLL